MIGRLLHRLIHGTPRQIIIGKGEVVVGFVETTEGRIGVLITPDFPPGETGEALPDLIKRGTRKDTILWVDGPATPLIEKLRTASAAVQHGAT